MNWTWNAQGHTYTNVAITDLKPDTVTINSSEGTATMPIDVLPNDIQAQLGYDPTGMMALRTENAREASHSFYIVAALDEAQRAARQLHWPVAWIDCDLNSMHGNNPAPNSESDLVQRAVSYLKSRAIVVLIDGDKELATLAPPLLHDQFYQLDDGPIPDGRHFYPPKIVFTDAGVLKAFCRVSHTKLLASHELAIEAALQMINQDPSDRHLLDYQPETPVILLK
jgi:hypothetical protein